MRNRIVGIVVLLILVAGGFLAFNNVAPGARPTPTPVITQIKAAGANIVSAEGEVVPAQHATLAFKMSGRIVEIPTREGDAVKAGAVLARLDDTMLKAQVAQAQSAVNVAQKQLAQLRAGATAAERQAAKDAHVAARAALAKVKAGPTADDLAALKANVDSAQAALDQAQFRYDRIGGDANPFGRAAPEALMLQQAWNSFAAVQAAYRSAVSHPTESELRAAESAVTQAESAIARLDPTPEMLALAQAQVDQAQAALDLAKAAAQDALLIAPFDGTVAAIAVHAGQVVAPGAPAMTFGSLSKLQIETTNLAEVDVAKAAVDQKVNITLDAFPNKTFHGQVLTIAPVANDHRGDKVYKVTIALLDSDPGVRWGMTANVEIGLEK